MAPLSSSTRRRRNPTTTMTTTKWLFFLVVVAVVVGCQRGGRGVVAAAAGGGHHDETSKTPNDDETERQLFPSFEEMATATDFFGRNGFPSFFKDGSGFWHHSGSKATVNKKGKCVFSLTWEKGVKCSDFSAFADVAAKSVGWRYHHSEQRQTGTSSSSRSEGVEQSTTLDNDCLLNEAVLEMQLAGYMTNDASDCAKGGLKVEIFFPSKTKALAVERSGGLPEGTAKALEEGDAKVLSKLTDRQVCALLLDGCDGYHLNRSLQLPQEKSEEAPSGNSGSLRASHKVAEGLAAQGTSRIPLVQIGYIGKEA